MPLTKTPKNENDMSRQDFWIMVSTTTAVTTTFAFFMVLYINPWAVAAIVTLPVLASGLIVKLLTTPINDKEKIDE